MGLVFDRIRWEEKALVERAKASRVKVKLLDAKSVTLNGESPLKALRETFGDIVLQRCISYYRGLHLTAFLESKGLKVINTYQTSEVCGNKVLTTLELERAGIPTPKTIISFTGDSALEAMEEIGLPVVLKPVSGSWGRMVLPIKDKASAQAVLEMREQMGGPLNQIYYIQKMIDRPDRDIRAIVVDDRVVTTIYRYAPPGEWRTNVARGGMTKPCPLTEELEDLVMKAAEAVGGGVLGVDAMESSEGILVHEVNGTVEFKGAASASSVDIADSIVRYVKEEARR